MAGWGYSTSLTLNQNVICLREDAGSAKSTNVRFGGSDSGDYLQATAYDGASISFASSSISYSTNTWHHCAGVWASTTSRSVYLDGGNKGTNTVSRDTGTMTRFAIGSNFGFQDLNGKAAEWAFWNVALTDADVALLAKGAHPLSVKPQNILHYWPVIGRTDPEIDWIMA